jgi:hypothetical protein
MGLAYEQNAEAAHQRPDAPIRFGGMAGLCAAVVQQAWRDLFDALPSGDGGSYANKVTPMERHEAKLFLTEPRGNWAKARQWYCHGAGIDPDALRNAALKRAA